MVALTEEPIACGKDVWASTNQHGTVVFVTRLSRRMRRSPGSDRIERWTEGEAEALLLTGAMVQSYEEGLDRRTEAAKHAALVNAVLLAACLCFAAMELFLGVLSRPIASALDAHVLLVQASMLAIAAALLALGWKARPPEALPHGPLLGRTSVSGDPRSTASINRPPGSLADQLEHARSFSCKDVLEVLRSEDPLLFELAPSEQYALVSADLTDPNSLQQLLQLLRKDRAVKAHYASQRAEAEAERLGREAADHARRIHARLRQNEQERCRVVDGSPEEEEKEGSSP